MPAPRQSGRPCRRQMGMFSDVKTMHMYAESDGPAGVWTLVVQRATEVTHIPGVLQQPGWVRPEGGAPSEKRASGYEPFDRSVASRARNTGRGAGGIGGQHRRRADPPGHPYGIHDPAGRPAAARQLIPETTMTAFENTVTITRPVEEVFTYLADAENLPQWNYAIEQTRKIPRARWASAPSTGRPGPSPAGARRISRSSSSSRPASWRSTALSGRSKPGPATCSSRELGGRSGRRRGTSSPRQPRAAAARAAGDPEGQVSGR